MSFLLTADIVKVYIVNDFDEIKLYFLNHHPRICSFLLLI